MQKIKNLVINHINNMVNNSNYEKSVVTIIEDDEPLYDVLQDGPAKLFIDSLPSKGVYKYLWIHESTVLAGTVTI